MLASHVEEQDIAAVGTTAEHAHATLGDLKRECGPLTRRAAFKQFDANGGHTSANRIKDHVAVDIDLDKQERPQCTSRATIVQNLGHRGTSMRLGRLGRVDGASFVALRTIEEDVQH
ncbi:MAG: hypothetical protein ABIV63_10385, partial [Caldimonas sp.]